MGLEVYYPTDILNALLAAEQATNAATQATGDQDNPFAAGYSVGYRAALATMALAFGLEPQRETETLEPAWYPVALSRGR